MKPVSLALQPVLLLLLFVAGLAFAQTMPWPDRPLVDPAYLRSHGDELLILDIRPTADYKKGHIPGSLNADYFAKGWAKTRNGVPNMAPEPDMLAEVAGQFGIEQETGVVIVSASDSVTDIGGAARMVWLLTYLGHDKVALLDGGIRSWVEDGGRLTSQETQREETFPYPLDNLRPQLLAQLKDIPAAVQLVDARPADYHHGWQKHPKARIAGSLANSQQLEHAQFVDPATLRFVTPQKVDALIAQHGMDARAPVVIYCNTGWWAATSWFGWYFLAGDKQAALYDGSMVEWTLDASRMVVHTKSRFDHVWRELKEMVGFGERSKTNI